MRVYLETERLVLRRFTEADAGNLFDLDSDPEVMRFLNGGKPTPRHVVENDIIPRYLRQYGRYPGYGHWAAIKKSTGAFLGWLGLVPTKIDGVEDVELAYRLRKAAWGHGYATEGARALIRKGFTELGMQRVFATTYQDNLASRRVMEKAGLILVRTFRITAADLLEEGTTHVAAQELWDGDDVEYALDKVGWEQQAASGPYRQGWLRTRTVRNSNRRRPRARQYSTGPRASIVPAGV